MSTAECCKGALPPSVLAPQPGEETSLCGAPTFVARGTDGARAPVALVYLVDIFGYAAVQARANAARMAAAGGGKLDVLIPDICAGDACSHDFDFANLPAWFSKHGDDVTTPLVDAAVRGAREAGYSKVVTVGYCWGARASLLAGRAGAARANTAASAVSRPPSAARTRGSRSGQRLRRNRPRPAGSRSPAAGSTAAAGRAGHPEYERRPSRS